jgi:hypothetical protein
MNSKVFEQYKFYRLYDHDFDAAIHTLKIQKRYRRPDVRNALLRDIIVTYTRPFSISKGDKIHRHILPAKFVPSQLRKLHNELLDLRNQLFAHTDLIYKNPRVANWSAGQRKWFPMSFRGFDYGSLNKRVANILNLICTVQRELQKKIKKIENHF